MKKEERIQTVLDIIKKESNPISASAIGKLLSVSRQIIVGDIALLRAQGQDIESTPKGYRYYQGRTTVIDSIHDVKDTEEELRILVEHGIEIVDVWIDHPVYKIIKGDLNIKSFDDIDSFLKKESALLLSLTDGSHYHTLRSNDPEKLNQAILQLEAKGFIK